MQIGVLERVPIVIFSNLRFGVLSRLLIKLILIGKHSTKPSLGPFNTVEVGGSVIALFSKSLSPNESAFSSLSQIRIALPKSKSSTTFSKSHVLVFSGQFKALKILFSLTFPLKVDSGRRISSPRKFLSVKSLTKIIPS